MAESIAESTVGNPFYQPAQLIEIELEGDGDTVGIASAALEDMALSVSHQWRNEVAHQLRLLVDASVQPELMTRLSALQAHYPLTLVHLQPLQHQDWVSQVQANFPALAAGRFYVHGSHQSGSAPPGLIPILLDAGAAFGTGEHETTYGCLLAMDRLMKRRAYRRILDMGCGSGILAIAAAKARRSAFVHAVDNDPVSVCVSRENAVRNQVAGRVRLAVGDGYAASLVQGHYDLIISNILARPLMRMAGDLRRHLAPGGTVVLAGLLSWQARMVLAAHRCQSLRLAQQFSIGRWSILVLEG